MRQTIVIVLIALFCACNSTKKTNTTDMKCEHTGIVKDHTGLDGCKYLIELKNGDKLQPVEVVDNFQWQDGQQINFSYEEMPDAMTTCMAGKVVKVTCVEVIGE